MKFKFLTVLAVLVFTLLNFCGCGNDVANNDAESNDIAIESALTQDAIVFIGNLLAENLYNGTWGNINLVTSCSTYDYDSKYNGRLYKVETEESASGYIQIVYRNDEWQLAEYNFDNSDLFEKVGDHKTLYYLGEGTYCTKKGEVFSSLLDDKTYSKAEAKALYTK